MADIMTLKEASAKALVEELTRREMVKELFIEPHDPYSIIIRGRDIISDVGPAIILIVTD
jgi:hypothetical protein